MKMATAPLAPCGDNPQGVRADGKTEAMPFVKCMVGVY